MSMLANCPFSKDQPHHPDRSVCARVATHPHPIFQDLDDRPPTPASPIILLGIWFKHLGRGLKQQGHVGSVGKPYSKGGFDRGRAKDRRMRIDRPWAGK